MEGKEKDEALATPKFWNGRYAKFDGQNPTHEWFRTFEALEPFSPETCLIHENLNRI